MAYAFARDGGLPFSGALRRVSPAPPHAGRPPSGPRPRPLGRLHRLHAGLLDHHRGLHHLPLPLVRDADRARPRSPTAAPGRRWARGASGAGIARWRCVAVLFCVLLIVIGVQPPNDKALWIVLGDRRRCWRRGGSGGSGGGSGARRAGPRLGPRPGPRGSGTFTGLTRARNRQHGSLLVIFCRARAAEASPPAPRRWGGWSSARRAGGG